MENSKVVNEIFEQIDLLQQAKDKLLEINANLDSYTEEELRLKLKFANEIKRIITEKLE